MPAFEAEVRKRTGAPVTAKLLATDGMAIWGGGILFITAELHGPCASSWRSAQHVDSHACRLERSRGTLYTLRDALGGDFGSVLFLTALHVSKTFLLTLVIHSPIASSVRSTAGG